MLVWIKKLTLVPVLFNLQHNAWHWQERKKFWMCIKSCLRTCATPWSFGLLEDNSGCKEHRRNIHLLYILFSKLRGLAVVFCLFLYFVCVWKSCHLAARFVLQLHGSYIFLKPQLDSRFSTIKPDNFCYKT